MGTLIEKRAWTVTVDGSTTDELLQERFPKGTIIQFLAFAGGKFQFETSTDCLIVDSGGSIIYRAFLPFQGVDQMVLNRDVYGIKVTITTLKEGTALLHLIRPTGRVFGGVAHKYRNRHILMEL